jgi:hypothetical protein
MKRRELISGALVAAVASQSGAVETGGRKVTVEVPPERDGDVEILGAFYFIKPDGTMFRCGIVLTPQDYCVPQWPADGPKRVCGDTPFSDAIATRVEQFAITAIQHMQADTAWLASVKARCAAVLARRS